MTNKEIKRLIDAFYDGALTDAEEETLRTFFLSGKTLPSQWEHEQIFFEVFFTAVEVPIPDGLPERLKKSLDLLAAKEKKINFRYPIYAVASVAAVFLICLGIFIGKGNVSDQHLMADTFTSPVEAALVAQETLVFMSSQLNNGLNQVSEMKEEIKNVNKIMREQFK